MKMSNVWAVLLVSAIGIVRDAAAVPENNLSLPPVSALAASSTFAEFVPPHTIYWSNVIYHPTGKLISEIPIAAIDSTWCAADTFTNKMFPQDIAKEMKSKFSEYGFSLNITNFKAGSNKYLDALVGAYRDCKTTQTGIFFVIIDKKMPARPSILYKENFPNEMFAMLKIDQGKSIHLVFDGFQGSDYGLSYWWVDGKFKKVTENDNSD